MNRSTIGLLVAAVALGLITWFVTRTPTPVALPRLDLAGYATPAQLATERELSILDEAPPLASPIDELSIEWPGRKRMVLKRIDEGDGQRWRIIEPIDAPAEAFVVEQIVALFKAPTQSREAREFREDDARLYGFEPQNRARLTAKAGGEVWNGVDLYLGDVRRPRGQDRAEPDTWVMPAGALDYVFAVHAKDMRAPLERGLESLRDKRIFELQSQDISRAVLRAADGAELTLAPESGGGSGVGSDPTWTILAPPGLGLDASGQSFISQALGLRATTFIPLAEISPEERAHLDAGRWAMTFEAKDGEVITAQLTMQADGTALGRLAGRDEAFVLSKWSATTAMMGLAELRDRRVVIFEPETNLAFDAPTDEGRITANRANEGWTVASEGETLPADPSEYLSAINSLMTNRWARPAEVEEARAALQSPALEASFTTANAKITLIYSQPFEREGQQLRWGAIGHDLFLISDFAAQKVATSVDALRLKRLFGMDAQTVTRIEVRRRDGEGYALSRSRDGAPLQLVGHANGDNVEGTQPESLLAKILDLSADRFGTETQWRQHPGPITTIKVEAGRDAVVTLTLKYLDDGAGPLAKVKGGRLSDAVVTLSARRLSEILSPREALPAAP